MPSAFGTKWTEEESKRLLEEIKNGLEFEEIAKIHNRSVGGVRARLRQHAYAMYLNKDPIELIMETTKLSKENILETIDNREYMKNKKDKDKNTRDESKIKPEKVKKEENKTIDIVINASIPNPFTDMEIRMLDMQKQLDELNKRLTSVENIGKLKEKYGQI